MLIFKQIQEADFSQIKQKLKKCTFVNTNFESANVSRIILFFYTIIWNLLCFEKSMTHGNI